MAIDNKSVVFYNSKDRTYIRIKTETVVVSTTDRPVTEQDKQKWPEEWALFKSDE